MPALPIVGKIEFDIDMRRAPWYETFCNRAHQQMAQRRLPSRVTTPVGVLATPAPRSPSPVTLGLPPRARSASPAPGGDTKLFPPSPSSSKFPMHLQLPSNPANRSDRGLLSPKDAMFPTPSSSDDETVSPSLGLGLQLSPSSSTVADGSLGDVVPEGGYAALSDDEQDLQPGQDPLGDVFPEDETWDTSTRAIKGIEDLPIPEPEEDEDEPNDEKDVAQLWNEHNRPGISLAPPPTPSFSRPTDPSAVVFPKPAPQRQRSDSVKRPPPLKLEEQEGAKEEQQTEIVVTGEDGEDWNWRSSEHVRKERLDELEKALAQLSPRILEPPPPEFDRPRSPGLHHRMLSGGTLRAGAARPDPHAPLFMSEELSSLRASMAAKNGSAPTTPRTPKTPPMTAESRIRMQTEHKLDLANLPPPGTAPPRPRRPQTPVALNSPPFEESPPVPNHQRSRFSMDSNGDEIPSTGLAAPNRERANSIMSVKGIKKLWRGRNSTQNLNGVASGNRDSQLPVTGGGQHKRDSSNSGKDPFHFDQEVTKDKDGKPATKSILKKWSSKPNDPKLSPKIGQSQPHSARGSISSVNTLTNGGLQAAESGRPSVSSSLASDGEPMTPRMSQFEMVVPNGQQS